MALSAATVRKRRSLDQMRKGYGVVKTSNTIYPGALISVTEADGLLVPASAAAGETFVGISLSDTAVGVAAGTVGVEYAWGHEELVTAKTSLTTTYRMCAVVAFDDDQVTIASAVSTAKRAYAGFSADFDSSGNCWLLVDPTAGGKIAP